MTVIKRCSHGSIAIVKRFLSETFPSPVKNGPQNGANSEKWGLYIIFHVYYLKKAHPCAEVYVLAQFAPLSMTVNNL